MDLSRFASGVGPSRAAPRPGLQIGAAGNSFRTCSLRQPRHRGGNLMFAQALRVCAATTGGGLFYLASKRRSPLGFHIRGHPPPRCQGSNDSSLDYVDGPLEGTNGTGGEVNDEEATSSAGSDDDEATGGGGREVDVDALKEILQRSRNELRWPGATEGGRNGYSESGGTNAGSARGDGQWTTL